MRGEKYAGRDDDDDDDDDDEQALESKSQPALPTAAARPDSRALTAAFARRLADESISARDAYPPGFVATGAAQCEGVTAGLNARDRNFLTWVREHYGGHVRLTTTSVRLPT